MKIKARFEYLFLVIITIILGLLSRKLSSTYYFIGDILYAVLIYWGFRFLFPFVATAKTAVLSLFFCYSIEFSQLYKSDWINSIRTTTIGHYVLGQGFLLSDLLCYFMGTLTAYYLDILYRKKN
jgi:Protein of unknown function (DUF2809)